MAAGPPCPGPITYIMFTSWVTITRLRWDQRKFRPGVVPQWPSSRGLICSGRSGCVSNGLLIR